MTSAAQEGSGVGPEQARGGVDATLLRASWTGNSQTERSQEIVRELRGIVPADGRQPYDVRDVISGIVDGGEFLEVQANWARNLVIGFSRIDGRTVGIVANQAKWLAGVMTSSDLNPDSQDNRPIDATSHRSDPAARMR